jgi:hypothetical protein
MIKSKQKCPVCNNNMWYGCFNNYIYYKKERKLIVSIGWGCNYCSEVVFTGIGLIARNRQHIKFKKEMEKQEEYIKVADAFLNKTYSNTFKCF